MQKSDQILINQNITIFSRRTFPYFVVFLSARIKTTLKYDIFKPNLLCYEKLFTPFIPAVNRDIPVWDGVLTDRYRAGNGNRFRW